MNDNAQPTPTLTPAQHRALGNLHHNTPDGTAGPTVIQHRLGAATATVKALLRTELIEFVPGDETKMRLNRAGRAALDAADERLWQAARVAAADDPYALHNDEYEPVLQARFDARWCHNQWDSSLIDHTVRLRLAAKGIIALGLDGVHQLTEQGRTAADHVLYASMGRDYPTEPEPSTQALAHLRDGIELYGGQLAYMVERSAAAQELRQHGLVRPAGEQGTLVITAAGYVAARAHNDIDNLIRVAAEDYRHLRELSTQHPITAGVWSKSKLDIARDQLFFAASCPPGVDAEIFSEIVYEMDKTRMMADAEQQRHQEAVTLIEQQHQQLKHRAQQLADAHVMEDA